MLKVVLGTCEADDLAERVLAELQKHPDGRTTRAVRSTVRARDTYVDAALRRLEAAGRVTCTPGPRRALIWRAEGSGSDAVEKVEPERGLIPGHGPGQLDLWPRTESTS